MGALTRSGESPIPNISCAFLMIVVVMQVRGLHGWLFLDPVHYSHALHSPTPEHHVCYVGALQRMGKSSFSALSRDKSPVSFVL